MVASASSVSRSAGCRAWFASSAGSSLQSALAGHPWEVSIMLAGVQARADIFVTLPRPFSGGGFDAKLSVTGEQLRALSTFAWR
jgi:hypothetical protein